MNPPNIIPGQWKTWPEKPELDDLPIAVWLPAMNKVQFFDHMVPFYLREHPLIEGAQWCRINVKPPAEQEHEENHDPLDEHPTAKAIREANIAASNAESADHYRILFNTAYLLEVNK
jgi:hypothetical protein